MLNIASRQDSEVRVDDVNMNLASRAYLDDVTVKHGLVNFRHVFDWFRLELFEEDTVCCDFSDRLKITQNSTLNNSKLKTWSPRELQ